MEECDTQVDGTTTPELLVDFITSLDGSDVLWEVPLLTCGRSTRSAGNRVVREF